MSRNDTGMNAPDFPAGMEWLNTNRPLSIRELRGKVILLDFWTYCCINCMHVIPDLKKLEKEFRDELVVIGVHSAKFTAEQETDNIRQAVLRYEIAHPVVNDRDMEVWKRFAVHAWPTLVLIDPAGRIVGQRSGEEIYEPFRQAISSLIREFDVRGLVDRTPGLFAAKAEPVARSGLSFPGKVLADEPGDRLFIADSNHHRIVVVTLSTAEVVEVIGSGIMGLADGAFEEACFNNPQGMAVTGQKLYVADTGNHAIRAIDFGSREVTTIAGNGTQASFGERGGEAKTSRLNSPWDLVLAGEKLYIAMAGAHQIWALDLGNHQVRVHAGSGREGRVDSALLMAALAQPSGLATDGRLLYFSDSEVSAIRTADLSPEGNVKTIIGEDLFEFGDRDGHGSEVRLQHPLGVCCLNGHIYIADTYNNKVKRLDPSSGQTITLFGSGLPGFRDGRPALFHEPGGISPSQGRLYIADTNNHVIRMADLASGEVSTLVLKGMARLFEMEAETPLRGEPVVAERKTVSRGDVKIVIEAKLPAEYRLSPSAPHKVVLTARSGQIRFMGEESTAFTAPVFPVTTMAEAEGHDETVQVEALLYYCRRGQEALCHCRAVSLLVPFTITEATDKKTAVIHVEIVEQK